LPFDGTNSNQKAIGLKGEKIARVYLKKRGWRIVSKNVKFGVDELDILAVSPNESILAIVEVRSTDRHAGNPEATITARKKKAMRRVANQVKSRAEMHNFDLRVDVITVRLSPTIPAVQHYKGVIPL